MKVTKQDIALAIAAISRIDVCGTGCMPSAEHHRLAEEAMAHLHTATLRDIAAGWGGWKDSGLADVEIVRQIAVDRATAIVVRKHRWDYNYCFEAISYTPVLG